MNPRVAVRSGALITTQYLVGGLIVGVGIGAGVEAAIHPINVALGTTLAAVLAAVVLIVAGRAWARRMVVLGGFETASVGPSAGLFVAIPMIGIGALLSAIEPVAVRQAANMGFPLHDVYAVLFVLATFCIVSVGAFGVGSGVGQPRLGVRLAVRAAPIAALAYLTVVLVMFLLGWRVGAPDAGKRATMVVVTTVSALVTSVVAGAVLGHALATTRRPAPVEGLPHAA